MPSGYKTIVHAIKNITTIALPFLPINLPNKLEIQKPKRGNNKIDKNIKTK